MRGIITTLFLVLISNSLSGAGELNANNILILFPICETPSSLGQRCKHNYAESIPDNFLEVCCSDGANVQYKENSVSVSSSGNWYYNFDISRSSDGNYEIIFTDKAMNGGSYHSVTAFDVKLENGILLLEEINSKLF
jgi:hypothetical protein|tara:strand:+ start:1207 stop:1617 length:411 start_codon:yes stop_codon:yes gene_type:complete